MRRKILLLGVVWALGLGLARGFAQQHATDHCPGCMCGQFCPFCGPCACLKIAEGGGHCANDFFCAHAQPCATSDDCPYDQLCYVETCCPGGSVCGPIRCTGEIEGAEGTGPTAAGPPSPAPPRADHVVGCRPGSRTN